MLDGKAETWEDAERIHLAQDKNEWLFWTWLHKAGRGGFFGQLSNCQFSRSVVTVSHWGMSHKPAGRRLTHAALSLSLPHSAKCAAPLLSCSTPQLPSICCLWTSCIALKIIEVLIVRTDLLWAHYKGLGIQFFTVWSQVSTVCSNLCSYFSSNNQQDATW